MSSSDVNVYNKSGELSCTPVTLADHCDTKEHSDRALREGKLTEKDLPVAKQEGVVSPTDLDLVMSDGLGMRYAFIGPLETMHLNAEGISNYCERYRDGMRRVLNTFGPVPEFSGEIEQKINQAMSEKIPVVPKVLDARRKWRDECLTGLSKLKKQMKSDWSAPSLTGETK